MIVYTIQHHKLLEISKNEIIKNILSVTLERTILLNFMIFLFFCLIKLLLCVAQSQRSFPGRFGFWNYFQPCYKICVNLREVFKQFRTIERKTTFKKTSIYMRSGHRPTRPHAHDNFVYITKISHLLSASGEASSSKFFHSCFMYQIEKNCRRTLWA